MFNTLTPEILDKNNAIYTAALDYAFSNPEMQNIAITGIYGAGKSTVWKTYINEKKFEKVITVSLGKYTGDIDDEKTGDIDDEKTDDGDSNRIERQMINQMVAQINSKEIHLSKYQFKRNRSTKKVVTDVVLTFCFIFSFIIWLERDMLINNLKTIISWVNIQLIIGLCTILFLIPLAIFLSSIYRENKFKFSKISLQGTEAELSEEINDETILDREMKEIVYLLYSSKVEYVVFEDLDRYQNPEIFTKLRELNFLLNSYTRANGEQRTIRFVYMIKDGVFFSKNRTKFFDFIMPVVPIVDSKTSENKLLELFQDHANPPESSLLSKIALYVDDMRLLKNIVNEYTIYLDIIPFDNLQLEKNKLFGLMLLKNIFPNEFDLLQEDKGYIRHIFEQIEEVRTDVISQINEKLAATEKNISEIISNVKCDEFEVMATMIPANVRNGASNNQTWPEFLQSWSSDSKTTMAIYKNNSVSHYTYEKFIDAHILHNEQNKERLDAISRSKESDLAALRLKVENLKHKLSEAETATFSELIEDMAPTALNALFEAKSSEPITNNHYFPLIRTLIVQGILDETYWYYKGSLALNNSALLKKNDVIYLKCLLEGRSNDVLLDLETPQEIIKRLSAKDFKRFNILNKTLVVYCLTNNLDNYILQMIHTIKRYNNFSDLNKVLENLEIDVLGKYVTILLRNDPEYLQQNIQSFTDVYSITLEQILSFIYSTSDINSQTLQLFSNEIEQRANIIEQIPEEKFVTFLNNITIANIKFSHLTDTAITTDRLNDLERRKAYILTVAHVIFIFEKLLEKAIDYSRLIDTIYDSEVLTASKEYVEANFEQFICEYIDENIEGKQYNNSEKMLVKILNSGISDEYKLKYSQFNETVISNIEPLVNQAENFEIFDCLFEGNKITFTAENINNCWNSRQEHSDTFSQYLDNNLTSSNINTVFAANQGMCDVLINDPNISKQLFNSIINFAAKKIADIDDNLSDERVLTLIENNLLTVNDVNIQKIIDHRYNDCLVMLATNEDGENEEKIIAKIATKNIDPELAYLLINSNISDESTLAILNNLKANVRLEKINNDKSRAIEYIIGNYLTEENIEYICENFSIFKLADEFVKALNDQNLIHNLENAVLNDQLVNAILSAEYVSLEHKIQLIVTKITHTTDVMSIRQYIQAIPEIADLERVWVGGRPELNSAEKIKIADALVDATYIKKRADNRIMLIKDNQ